MFKKAVNKFLKVHSIKRLLILLLVFTVGIAAIDGIGLHIIQSTLPKKEVYNYFNNIATYVINLKSTEFLDHLNDCEYLENLDGLEESDVSEISKNSNFLKYYIVTKNSQKGTITVEQYGIRDKEKLTLVVSTDYKLISLYGDQPNSFEAFFLWLTICFCFGFIFAIITDLVLVGLEIIVNYFSGTWKNFRNLFKSKKAKQDKEEASFSTNIVDEAEFVSDADLEGESLKQPESEDDDEYYSEDYDEM